MKRNSDIDRVSNGHAGSGRGAVDNQRSQMAARRRHEIRQLRERGLSINEIADLLGVVAKTVRRHLQQPNVSRV